MSTQPISEPTSISPEITAQARALYEALRSVVDELLGSQDGSIPGLAAECRTVDEVKHLANVFTNLGRRCDNPRPFGSQPKGWAQIAFAKGMAAVSAATPVAAVSVDHLSVEELQAALAARSADAGDGSEEPF